MKFNKYKVVFCFVRAEGFSRYVVLKTSNLLYSRCICVNTNFKDFQGVYEIDKCIVLNKMIWPRLQVRRREILSSPKLGCVLQLKNGSEPGKVLSLNNTI